MLTVALVGGDGSGKTTIAERLQASAPWPAKYLYMGPSTLAGDHPLPTTRLARLLNLRALKREAAREGRPGPVEITSQDYHYGKRKISPLQRAARLLNRLAEATYRNCLSLIYQWRGYIVIYDRHFLFETSAGLRPGLVGRKIEVLLDRLEAWSMERLFPRPYLVLFLDAPSDQLYARKKEAGLAYLEARRDVILGRAWMVRRFIRIDASQPIDAVFSEVVRCIDDSRRRRHRD